jgi:hypothetical protein
VLSTYLSTSQDLKSEGKLSRLSDDFDLGWSLIARQPHWQSQCHHRQSSHAVLKITTNSPRSTLIINCHLHWHDRKAVAHYKPGHDATAWTWSTVSLGLIAWLKSCLAALSAEVTCLSHEPLKDREIGLFGLYIYMIMLRLWSYCHLAPNVFTRNQLVFSLLYLSLSFTNWQMEANSK